MGDTQETENETVITLLENISKKLDSISEYIEFKKRDELYRRQLERCYPREKLLPDENDPEIRIRSW